MLHRSQLVRWIFAALVLFASGATLRAETIQITGTFFPQFGSPDFSGAFTITFDVSGLPVPNPPIPGSGGPFVDVTNVAVSLIFHNLTQDSGTGGTGLLFSNYPGASPDPFDFISFGAGDISGLFALIPLYTGNGGVLNADNDKNSILDAGGLILNLDQANSSVVATPEPDGWVLAAIGLSWYATIRAYRGGRGWNLYRLRSSR